MLSNGSDFDQTKGHKDFVPAMISRGAASADSAMIILDSSLGNFEAGFERRGQTREHLIILRALGCRKGISIIPSGYHKAPNFVN